MMQEFVDQINKSARSATEDMHTALPGEIKATTRTRVSPQCYRRQSSQSLMAA